MPAPRGDDLPAIQRSLETLLRLNASRGVHANVVGAAGVSLSQPGYTLLRRVDEQGPTPLGDLARSTHMDPAVVSRQIRQLEDDGLVRRLADARDGRVTLIEVTPRGRAVRERVSDVLERHISDALDRWTPDDRRRLGELLGRLVDDLRAVRYRPQTEETSA